MLIKTKISVLNIKPFRYADRYNINIFLTYD